MFWKRQEENTNVESNGKLNGRERECEKGR